MSWKKSGAEPKDGKSKTGNRTLAPEARRSETKGSVNPRRESGSDGLASESTQSKKAETPRAARDA